MYHNEAINRLVSILLLCTPLSGCGSSPEHSELVEISGVIKVDGQPAKGIVVTLHPAAAEHPTSAGAVSTGFSKSNGRFEISTYRLGDGALPGLYDVTCVWSEFDPVSRSMRGDKLLGRYASPEKPAVQWNISESDSEDMGTIDLQTK